MSLTVTESQAVFVLLDWLAGAVPPWDGGEIERGAIESMELLGAHAGKTLQMVSDERLPGRVVERLRAADSDGAAQAVCRALDAHKRHGGSIPWPSVSGPFADWQAMHAAAAT